MLKGLWRIAAAAALTVVAGIACSGPASNQWTHDEIKQLTSITDNALSLVASLSHGEKSPSELLPAVRPIVAAARAAVQRINRHAADIQLKDRLNTMNYVEATSCVQTTSTLALDIDMFVKKLEEAQRKDDEAKIAENQLLLTYFAQESTSCAVSLAEFLRTTHSPHAVDKIGAAIGEIYALTIALRALAGLGLEGLLKDQIAANESLVARLAQECEASRRASSGAPVSQRCVAHTLAVDALPKLRSALSLLTTKRA